MHLACGEAIHTCRMYDVQSEYLSLPTNVSQLVKTNAQIGNVRTRGKNNLILPKVRTELYRKSFTFRASQDWNKLPKDVRDLDDPSEFKRKLSYIDF